MYKYTVGVLQPNQIRKLYNCLCGSVAKASDTQAVGREFEPRPDH